jgi:hypothetical protein
MQEEHPLDFILASIARQARLNTITSVTTSTDTLYTHAFTYCRVLVSRTFTHRSDVSLSAPTV